MAHRIDTHQHFIPPTYAQWLNERGIRPGGIDLPSWSPSRALRFMDRHDVAAAVLSLSTPGVHLGDFAEARRWARTVNEYTAEIVRDHPGRFGFFATLTPPDVDGSLIEAQYALDVLGADGIRFILGHAGGFLPYISYRVMLAMTQRVNRVVQAATVVAPDRMVPRHLSVLRRFYFDTALSSTPAALPSLLEIADPERILHGTDFPFAPPPAVRLMNHYYERVPLSETVRRSIDHQAATRLFPRLAGRLPL